jgi:23S rRNA (uridine2552-2'-O)-methyltransferase
MAWCSRVTPVTNVMMRQVAVLYRGGDSRIEAFPQGVSQIGYLLRRRVSSSGGHNKKGDASQKQKRKVTKSSRAWLDRQASDEYVKKKGDSPSRSIFKLEQIHKKHSFLRGNNGRSPKVVVDLGAAPGGWSLYASRHLSPSSTLLAVDLLPLDEQTHAKLEQAPHEFHALQGDFTSAQMQDEIRKYGSAASGAVNVVLSDMAPNFLGDARTDALRTMHLCEHVLHFSMPLLHPGGTVLMKFFATGTNELAELARSCHFSTVKVIKPPASRKQSSEQYLLAMDYKPP